MKVLFCSAEVTPFAKTGGLGDVCGALPLALEKKGIEVALVMPRYRCVDPEKFALTKIQNDISMAKIGKNIPVYFIESDTYFNRGGLYGDKFGDYYDNFDRFNYFCRQCLELPKRIGFKPDIVHCHDWHTALIPVFLKYANKNDAFTKNVRSILTIHNLAYQGIFTRWEFFKLGLRKELFGIDGFEFFGNLNLFKAGIIFSDMVTTVSPGYAKEIQTEELGCGLDGVIRKRKKPIVGILNGLDYDIWNPENDPLVTKAYSEKTFENKTANKITLQKTVGFKADKDTPLFGFVGRLTSQKGLDLLSTAMDDIAKHDLQIVFLGTGDDKYNSMLKSLARRFAKKIAIDLEYDEPMAHMIYSGADMLLMPSVFEPCGLSQMIALRYGTIPLVFKTGGLADTISDISSRNGQGNGFVFERYTKEALLNAVKSAVAVYQDKKKFNALIKKAFTYNFSWEESAKKYKELYERCLLSA